MRHCVISTRIGHNGTTRDENTLTLHKLERSNWNTELLSVVDVLYRVVKG